MLLVMLVSGCRIETRPPVGSALDDAPLVAAIQAMYAAFSQLSTSALDSVAFAAATVVVAEPGPTVLIPLHTLVRVPGPRAGGESIRLLRTEVRSEGSVATVRVLLARAGRQASDLVTLGLRDDRWWVAHVALGRWRPREAP